LENPIGFTNWFCTCCFYAKFTQRNHTQKRYPPFEKKIPNTNKFCIFASDYSLINDE